jgi:hypothetical protein
MKAKKREHPLCIYIFFTIFAVFYTTKIALHCMKTTTFEGQEIIPVRMDETNTTAESYAATITLDR